MKLRMLELTNVRRFAGQKTQLGPFGDGLTTITAQNEAGKSTFFDALHALLFIAHGSSSQEIRNLQPYSGGAVTIAALIEIDAKVYRIEKTFIAQKSARIIDNATGQILKQQGDAEAWIEETVNRTNKGPAGLLWVRQGATHVDPEGRDKDAGNVATRRDLMSSVRGQIDAVTGGRRMDKIVERCRRDLDAMATKSLKAKAGSPWKQLEDKAEDLRARKATLEHDVAQLSQALETKRRTKARLRELHDSDARAARAQQIAKAADAFAQADQYARRVDDADKALRLIAADKEKLIRQISDITQAQDRRKQLSEEIAKQQTQVANASEAQVRADKSLDDAQALIATKVSARQDLTASLTAARLTERSNRKWDRLRKLAEIIRALAPPQAKLHAAKAVLATAEVTPRDLDRLADLGRRISIAREQRRAQFASFSLHPSGGAIAQIDGKATASEGLVDRPLDLNLPGFGRINLRPAAGAGKGIEDPDALESELDGALKTLGFETLPLARDACQSRQRAISDQSVAIAEIRGLAPDGTDAVTTEWHALCAELGHAPDATPPAPTEPAVAAPLAEQIEEQMSDLDRQIEDHRAALKAVQANATKAASAAATANGLLNHLADEQAAMPQPEDETARLEALQKACDIEVAKEMQATQTLNGLRTDAPDLETLRAAHERLLSAEKADQDEIHSAERALARVNGAIETQSEGAVEEKLAEVDGQLAKATDRAARYEMEAKALALLLDHLDAARKAAQETYFEPIRNELRPLLAQLHAGADFELDPEKMLVGKIIRNGIEDAVDVLSGGAYEQIAILTRLAFAKLFAKQGTHVPVILDDALVHTDDERISTMFNMLSQAARDQQIIVLSCRTRAFSDLGGTRAFIETHPI